ncbi:Transcription factor [Acorus gramineus]|uniref:Protein IRON-RELATED TRANSCRIPTION FACTOR 2 n=1 Tax=Acorus gramineus TaxID=55184 RepID=A0AAV8ZVV3_ACOGR|nr:Transcription factor [Acorus gramineus]
MVSKETERHNQSLGFPTQHIEINPPSSSKTKLTHNAYERDRRRKLNSLFSSLQSLLPGIDHKNKMSVPSTISRVLKYIPELQKHVEGLRRLKEEMVMEISRRGDRAPCIEKNNYSSVTVSRVSDREFMVQMCVISGITRLSDVLMNLEMEGFLLLRASTFVGGPNKVFYNLHVQVIYLILFCFLWFYFEWRN